MRPKRNSNGGWSVNLKHARDELTKAIAAIDALPPSAESRAWAESLTANARAHVELATKLLAEAGR